MAMALNAQPGSPLGDLPHEFKCPLSQNIMTDPVVLVETGITFQRAAIEDWFARGLDMCPETKRPLTSSQLQPNTELRRRVLAWLKAKKTALQAKAAQPRPPTAQKAGSGASPDNMSPAASPGPSPRGLNELISQASAGQDDQELRSALDAPSDGERGQQTDLMALPTDGVARLRLHTPELAPPPPQAAAAVAAPPPRPVASVFAQKWAQQQPQPDVHDAPAVAEQAAGRQPSADAGPPQQQPPAQPSKSVFADEWGASSADAQPPSPQQPPPPPPPPPPQPSATKSIFADKWAAPQADMPPAGEPPEDAQPPTPPAQQPPRPPARSVFADKWASQGAGSGEIDSEPAALARADSAMAEAPHPAQPEPLQTSFVAFAAAKKRAAQPPQADSPVAAAAAAPGPRDPQRYAAAQQAVDAVPQPSASEGLAISPPQRPPGQWGSPVRTYSHYHEQRRASHEQSLATVAAAQQRWGNASRFPEWRPPAEAPPLSQQQKPDGQPAPRPISLVERIRLQKQQEAAAAGQPLGGGFTAPPPRPHAGPYIDQYGRQEPDYSPYAGLVMPPMQPMAPMLHAFPPSEAYAAPLAAQASGAYSQPSAAQAPETYRHPPPAAEAHDSAAPHHDAYSGQAAAQDDDAPVGEAAAQHSMDPPSGHQPSVFAQQGANQSPDATETGHPDGFKSQADTAAVHSSPDSEAQLQPQQSVFAQQWAQRGSAPGAEAQPEAGLEAEAEAPEDEDVPQDFDYWKPPVVAAAVGATAAAVALAGGSAAAASSGGMNGAAPAGPVGSHPRSSQEGDSYWQPPVAAPQQQRQPHASPQHSPRQQPLVSAESAEAQAARENVRRIIGRSVAAEEDLGAQPIPQTSAAQLQDDDFEAELAAAAAAAEKSTATVGAVSASAIGRDPSVDSLRAPSESAADPSLLQGGGAPASPTISPRSAPFEGLPAPAPAGEAVVYPSDLPADEPSMIARAQDILVTLSGPQMQLEQTRGGSAYQVWQLRELAADSSCRAAMLEANAIPTLASLLADKGLPCETYANAAATLMRLGAQDPEACEAIKQSGALASLADMLSSNAGACREAAALALAFIGWSDAGTKVAIFDAVANAGLRQEMQKLGGGRASLGRSPSITSEPSTPGSTAKSPFGSRPSPLKGLAAMLGSSSAADLRAAAALAHMLTARLPKEFAGRLQVRNTDVVPAMAALLGEADPASVYAAMSTLGNLCMAGAHGNIPAVLDTLVRGLDAGSLTSRCRCAEALWRLARSGSAAPDASVIAQLQTRGAALGVSLAQLLEDPSLEHGAAGASGALAVAGLAAALTHDTPPAALFGSAVASHGGVPKVEELRLALLVSDGALAHLAALLQHEEEWMRTAAAACLGNLAACRSDFKNAQPQGKRARLRAKFSSHAASSTPRAAICMAPNAVTNAAALLSSSRIELLAAVIAVLNNLVSNEDVRLTVLTQLSAQKGDFQATKERLLQCISLVGLPDRSQRAARFVLTRLDRQPKDAAKSSLQCCAPLPPRLQPAYYDIWAMSGARGGA